MEKPTKHPDTDETAFALSYRLQAIFRDAGLYRHVLGCKGTDAQKLLDAFQWLLDTPELDRSLKRHLTVALQRLAKRTELFPTCYELKDIEQDDHLPVAAGGFADIYKGKLDGQVVCLKSIRIYQNTRVEYLLRQISRESILWGQLVHENVLPFYGLFRFNNRVCFVSPWMEAGDVRTYVINNPQVNRGQLAVDVAKGLQYLHENGLVHGDLKGSNILIDGAGRARLTDFGISAMSDPQILAWTSTSSVVSKGGSVRWQAPELFNVKDDVDVKNTIESDIYAWSCVCFEIFTSTVPFADLQRESTIELQVMSGARPQRPPDDSPSWSEWGLTTSIWILMEACWQHDPDARPGTSKIISLLQMQTTSSTRLNEGTNLSSIRFRQRSNQPTDIVDVVSILDRVLSGTYARHTSLSNFFGKHHLRRRQYSLLKPSLSPRLSPGGYQSAVTHSRKVSATPQTSSVSVIDNGHQQHIHSAITISKPQGSVKKEDEDERKQHPAVICPARGCDSKFDCEEHLKGHIGSHDVFQCHWPGCGSLFMKQDDCRHHELMHIHFQTLLEWGAYDDQFAQLIYTPQKW